MAAQALGEPAMQLTMASKGTGGVAGASFAGAANIGRNRRMDLAHLHDGVPGSQAGSAGRTHHERVHDVDAVLDAMQDGMTGLHRIEELVEARVPKGRGTRAVRDGVVVLTPRPGRSELVVASRYELDPQARACGLPTKRIAAADVYVGVDTLVARAGEQIAPGTLRKLVGAGLTDVLLQDVYPAPISARVLVREHQQVRPGDGLIEGPLDPPELLKLQGIRGVQDYLVREIQTVYKTQGVDINDKHIEVIVRQMLRKRKVLHPGGSRFLPGQIVDKFVFEDENTRVRNAGGQEATTDWVLLGITEASLTTESFLSAASFQETTRVLTEAALRGKKDELVGLKENVIIGRLIPAGTGLPSYRSLELATPDGETLNVELQPCEEGLPLVIEDEDELEMLSGGRSVARPNPLPMDGFQEDY
jgi:DNA-directed RNA polymerase subunit beta'